MATLQGKPENIICRLHLRQRCNRGNACPYYHHPVYSLDYDSPSISWLNFCEDFKMGQCFKQDCRYFHVTNEEKDVYKQRKDIAPTLLEQAMRKALLLNVALTGTRATCKGFLQGGCTLTTCPYRHISRHEFANEVLNTLRNEFEIVLGPPAVTNMQGMQPQFQNIPVNNMGSQMNPMMQGIVPNPMPGNRITKEDPSEQMRKLEEENQEIYKALDPNQKANSLEEIRTRLLTLQAALQWKDESDTVNTGGFIDDGLPVGMAVVNYGHSDNNVAQIAQTNIDCMRRRDSVPMEPMYGRSNSFQSNPNPNMGIDNYDNPPMDLDQGDGHPDKESDCKLFIGGLDSVTGTHTLRSHFSRFGEIVDAIVMCDKKSTKSRGFGFVTFLKTYMAENAERNGPHRLDGKVVDVKFAKPRPEDDPWTSSSRRSDRDSSPDRNRNARMQAKLFIGGLSDEITTEVLTTYFQCYGRIVDAVSMQDPKTKRPRGFGFVEFSDDTMLQEVLTDNPHTILGCHVTVDRSMPRDATGSRRNEPAPEGAEPCKMFVGGLGYKTDEHDLREYFTRYGKILEVNVHRDNQGQSKRFAFVTFSEPCMIEDAKDGGPHEIDGRRVDVGYAAHRDKKKDREPPREKRRERRRTPDRSESRDPENECKLYIGNIASFMSEDDLEDYFMQFGDVKKAEIKGSGGEKNFGFVTFEDSQMVENVLNNGPHEISGHRVETGRAVSKGARDNRDNRNRNPRDDNRGNRRNSREDNSSSSQPCKLFVGSLSFDSTEESLSDYFCKYGEVVEAKISLNNKGTSRGFGFVTFADEISVQEALDVASHEIDGRQVNIGSAISKDKSRNREGGGDKRRRDQSPETVSLTSRRKAEKRSHLD